MENLICRKPLLYINLHILYYLFQDKFNYPKIIKIQRVHQEIHAEQVFIILFRLFSIGDSFKF